MCALAAIGLTIGLWAECAPAARAPSALQLQQWVTDSVAYEGRLSRWLHDSAVIDSLSRLAPTDSLYRLYRAMYIAQKPAVYVAPIACFEFNLRWQYGDAPAEAAMHRMMDTLWKPGEGDGLKAIERRMPSTAFFSISDSICGRPPRQRLPDTVAGTWLGDSYPRPVRPKPPA
jgi:hypothetical protein